MSAKVYHNGSWINFAATVEKQLVYMPLQLDMTSVRNLNSIGTSTSRKAGYFKVSSVSPLTIWDEFNVNEIDLTNYRNDLVDACGLQLTIWSITGIGENCEGFYVRTVIGEYMYPIHTIMDKNIEAVSGDWSNIVIKLPLHNLSAFLDINDLTRYFSFQMWCVADDPRETLFETLSGLQLDVVLSVLK